MQANTQPKIKLSEAIRAGCKYGPQIQRQFILCGMMFGSDIGTGTCALGAAALGSGWMPTMDMDAGDWVNEKFEGLLERQVNCPGICPVVTPQVGAVIMHLNDFHSWTRQQIADWVATIEAADEIPAVQVSESPASEIPVIPVFEEDLVCV